MSEENAALDEDSITLSEEQEVTEQTPTEESAPQASDSGQDAVQKRINKITADKYEQQRRADEAEKRAQELEEKLKSQPVKSDGAPKLEDFDYDDAKYQEALIDYKVEQKAKVFQQQQEQQAIQAQKQSAQAKFNAKVAEFDKPDYAEVVKRIPPLPAETLDALIQSENPMLVYYLGEHLDIADEIANSSPVVAAMRLGQISVQLASPQPKVKTSAAPDPIEPVNSGGAVTKERGPEGARFE